MTRRCSIFIADERQRVEGRKPDADQQVRTLGADAGDRLAHESRAIFKTAAEISRPVVGRQQFVAQVAVAMLHVNEPEADALGHFRCGDELVDEPAQIVVADHARVVVRVDAELGVELRVVICDFRFQP